MMEIPIIFEDSYLLAVNKPAGLPSQATTNLAKKNLYDEVKKYLLIKNTTGAYVALHHRLDAATSGLMLLGKDPRINKGLSELFSQHKIIKTYLAVVENYQAIDLSQWDKDWRVDNCLKIYQAGTFKKAKSASKGDRAVTEFRMIDISEKYAMVECRPQTGRLHQIRVHLSDQKIPVAGDFLYGRKSNFMRLMLHATRLEFIHPITKKKIVLESDPQWQLVSVEQNFKK